MMGVFKFLWLFNTLLDKLDISVYFNCNLIQSKTKLILCAKLKCSKNKLRVTVTWVAFPGELLD